MPDASEIPGTPEEWLNGAKADLALAGIPLPEGVAYESLCFHAQQAAEKALKAVHKYYEWPFRYTHNLEELMDGLTERGIELPEAVFDAMQLTAYAWQTRYPGLDEPVDAAEHREALRLANTVVEWAADEMRLSV